MRRTRKKEMRKKWTRWNSRRRWRTVRAAEHPLGIKGRLSCTEDNVNLGRALGCGLSVVDVLRAGTPQRLR